MCSLCVSAGALCVCKCFVFGINHVQKYLYNPSPFVAPPPGRHACKVGKENQHVQHQANGRGVEASTKAVGHCVYSSSSLS